MRNLIACHFLSLLGCLLYCLLPGQLMAETSLQIPTVTYQGVKLGSVDLSGVGIEVVLQVHNPNKQDLTVTGVNYQFAVANAPSIGGKLKLKETFKAEASREVGVAVKLPYGPSATTVMQLLSSKVPTPYKIQGSLTLLGTTPSYEYSHEGTLPPISTDLLTRFQQTAESDL